MLLSKQESNIDLFFTRGRHNNIDIYYISQSYFHLPKNTIRNNSNINILFKQTLRDIILLFHDIAGLDMKLEEWKQLCRKSWENDYDYLQIDRFAKIGNGRYTIRNCNKNNYIECTPETRPFWKLITLICVTLRNIPWFTHIRKDHVHISFKQSHSHYFKCCTQLKMLMI